MKTDPRNAEPQAAVRRHTYEEASAALKGVGVRWLQRNLHRLPHTRLGRTVYFTDADLERIDHLFHQEPESAQRRAVGELRPSPGNARAKQLRAI
ncbi:hypothetical protein GCM10027160_24160 [Streptomyces calidiresistens]|uniref:DNA-binding protein n=1 Tax=Streptomyces calidiresistens TaxID=1485586 RepID=A0A7W3XZ54_9ACTN|nr:DNA-binding protein [Streptomyces calidiresistens]MBB0232522.1 DNA-binding protein [Streptomyces calidiresistens]